MKGKNLVKIPGELYAPTPNGTVVSADGVKDYRLGKMQEDVNREVVETAEEAKRIAAQAAGSASSMENIVEVLKQQGEQDIATALDHEARLQGSETDIEKLQAQLSDYKFVEKTEAEMEAIIENDEAEPNVLYLVPEEEEE